MIVRTARAAADQLEPLLARAAGETFAVLHLDGERRLIAAMRFPASADEAMELPVRAVLATAIALGAQGLVIAHNHPSGNPEPSRADFKASRLLAETAAGLGIKLHDHLIFAGRSCRSLHELGLL